MATRRYVYVIVHPKTNKLLTDTAYEHRHAAVRNMELSHPKGEVKELLVYNSR